MNKIIRILHLEDQAFDADLIKRELKKADFQFELLWVVNKKDFQKGLNEFSPDIVLSDHELPSFSSLEALEMLKKFGLKIPFILITSAMSDGFAVNLVKGGISDYILKDRIHRLPVAILNALEKFEAEREKQRYYEEVIRSEKLYRNIVETAQEGIWTIDENKRTNFVNKKMADILGYSPEEMIGKEVSDFVDDEWKKIGAEQLERLKTEPYKTREFKFITKSGKHIWTSLSTNAIFSDDGTYKGALAMVADITERKKLHEKLVSTELKIRNFARHLNHVQEEERAHIAREIHDELGQQLAGIKMHLSLFMKTNPSNSVLQESVNSMIKDVDATIQSLRKIATDLRPGILDSLGLIPSIRWLGSEFERKTKVKCKVEVNVTDQKFEKNISTCFFRICQETLTNVSKHAKASEVIISISLVKNALTLKIIDNGKGISNEKLENPFSMGLLGMRERANIIGADLQISSKKDSGTTVQLEAKIN